MTRKTLDKLPEKVLMHIERLRKDYKKNGDEASRYASYNYILGLCDAGLITEQERKTLFIYTTV